MVMNVLVTGGAGFIGSNFVHFLLKQPSVDRIVNVDALTYAANLTSLSDVAQDKRYRFVHADINNTDKLRQLIKEERITHLVNFAAESHVDRSIIDATPFYHSNVAGVLSLLTVVKETSLTRFLQVSTDEVYGTIGTHQRPVDEQGQIKPSSPYAASKAAANLFVLADFKTYQTPVVISRSANNYGPYQHPEKLIPKTIQNGLAGRPIPVYGSGHQIRDWLAVSDNCAAIWAVLTQGVDGQVYNVAAGQEAANLSIISRILRRLNAAPDLIEHVTDRPGHDFRYAMTHEKLTSLTDWHPRISLDSGLAQTVAWYTNHQDWLKGFRN
ncbi:dTDP-glucose 4,6-dehydratase [Secundilactobacillus kimchicus]|uniref:dTDP-glucose 4,6-dehydratase n=1 Tax=Secundilactobacillus kimchicus JCM 15530 TaxID=1302272 RepID=A0A0R1HRQ0_9LACO|nr:dTDP-glucose 4,6-dehydratase [Secundilactobacillus kimchicus]KRK49312.1 hypothetical protein FC96_GL000236 [Secundilactobacillus kimchicus JCM 15530]